MARFYTFAAGPSAFPDKVLERARDELLEWEDSGMSVMEMSHRGKTFLGIAEKAEADLRELHTIPDSYKVLFLQGGATGQFAAVPQNLLGDSNKTAYVDTGSWLQKAIGEGQCYAKIAIAASAKDASYSTIPERTIWNLPSGAAYLYYTANETVGGVEFHEIPNAGGLPLVADVSANCLPRPLDIGRYAAIYAGAQKITGSAGITVVIVREDLLGKTRSITPSILDWRKQAEEGRC